MPISELLTRTATITHKTEGEEVDAYGNEIPVTEETSVTCEIQQTKRSESAEGEVSDTHWLGVFPVYTDLDTGDTVKAEGIGTLELVGAPWVARDPETGVLSHIEATLRRTAGPEEGSGS